MLPALLGRKQKSHDYLYWDQRCSRQEADYVFKIDMEAFGVDAITVKLLYGAVSEFGETAWERNRALRAAGEPRVLPQSELHNFLESTFDSTKSWQLLKMALLTKSGKPEIAVKQAQADPNPELASLCKRVLPQAR